MLVRKLLKRLDKLRHDRRMIAAASTLTWGKHGEDLAFRKLQESGYVVVARNFRTRSGSSEIDLIAWHGDTLVFVEVKSRSSAEFGTPERAVDEVKRQHISRGAREYLRRHELEDTSVRFDIVTVLFGPPLQIDLLPDAFGWHSPDSHRQRRAAFVSG